MPYSGMARLRPAKKGTKGSSISDGSRPTKDERRKSWELTHSLLPSPLDGGSIVLDRIESVTVERLLSSLELVVLLGQQISVGQGVGVVGSLERSVGFEPELLDESLIMRKQVRRRGR